MPNLAEHNLCTGCNACVSICPKRCIEMKKDSNGFTYPSIVESADCIECGACERACPVLNKSISAGFKFPLAYAACTKEDSIRSESSSGGIFTEIATRILVQNGIVFGATYSEQQEIYHCCVEKIEDLQKLRGAKYAESSIKKSFGEIKKYLNQGRMVLFSGTPCQVAGLKLFLQKDYDNLICVDFVCHGVPSPMAWDEYLKYRMKEDKEDNLPVEINLRSKKTGWSRYQYSTEFKYEDGKIYSCKNGENLFMKLFVGDYINRESCSDCQFKGYSRVSDFTLGDFWGIWDIDPSMDDDKGTSLVLLQSEKAKKMWEEISSNVKYKEVTLEQASQQNPSILVSSKAKENRTQVLELIRDGKIDECNKLFIENQRSRGKLYNLIRRIIR